ncbi:hypothetical protein TNIN_372951 [Trichonephila inaurata madagascariensis]|uniref:Uncharacterized protein n=1 Tax=Trichonephila inaurata madagascariensis TaxID=2747483 RepID=A0A8X7CLA0_9ARAC|nr:hypothetical protein TNIN_372951 [Trichonephila inaurata madagascariensis]
MFLSRKDSGHKKIKSLSSTPDVCAYVFHHHRSPYGGETHEEIWEHNTYSKYNCIRVIVSISNQSISKGNVKIRDHCAKPYLYGFHMNVTVIMDIYGNSEIVCNPLLFTKHKSTIPGVVFHF